MNASPRLVAAVDLGGTKIRSVVVDKTGAILAADQRPTDAADGQSAVIERVVDAVRASVAGAGLTLDDIAGIGVAAAGPVDFEHGVLLEAPNLPGWQDVALAALLADRLGRPAFLENDANAAAVGEWRYGAGRGARHMLYFTISTGIGAGLILDGRLYRGADGTAGELGHVLLDERGPLDDCGLHGCLEILASGTAIARRAREGLAAADSAVGAHDRARAARESSALQRLAAARGELTAREVQEAAEAGDPLASRVLAQAAHSLALGLANYLNIFNPQAIVIGGGAANIWDAFIQPAFAEAQRLAFARPAATARLYPAALGSDSGVLGVAALTVDALPQ